MFYATIWALLPPVVAIALALITKEVYSSLFLGIVVGAALVAGFAPVKTLDVIINDGFIAGVADAWNVGIFLFLILLGILVALMNRTGGSAAFGRWAEKHVHTRAGAMLATVLLGVLIFVDDYFNCLTVGSVMRPVADGHRISRAKLDRRARVHDRADLLVGGGGLRHRGRERHVRHGAVRPCHPLELLQPLYACFRCRSLAHAV